MERIKNITLLVGKLKDDKGNIIEFDSYWKMKYNGEVVIESVGQLIYPFFSTSKLGRIQIIKIDDEHIQIHFWFDGAPSKKINESELFTKVNS